MTDLTVGHLLKCNVVQPRHGLHGGGVCPNYSKEFGNAAISNCCLYNRPSLTSKAFVVESKKLYLGVLMVRVRALRVAPCKGEGHLKLDIDVTIPNGMLAHQRTNCKELK